MASKVLIVMTLLLVVALLMTSSEVARATATESGKQLNEVVVETHGRGGYNHEVNHEVAAETEGRSGYNHEVNHEVAAKTEGRSGYNHEVNHKVAAETQGHGGYNRVKGAGTGTLTKDEIIAQAQRFCPCCGYFRRRCVRLCCPKD